MLNKDQLRLTLLGVRATLFSPPTGPTIAPPALAPKAASEIYGELARYGFSNFQLVPGGAQMATADGVSILTLTGAGWTYQEDLGRSAFDMALDKLDVAISHFVGRLQAGTMMINQLVDLQAQWETGAASDAVIEQVYLKEAVRTLAERIGGLDYQGSGIRLNLSRPSKDPLPTGFALAGPSGQPAEPRDSFDVRLEPFFADKSKMFVQVAAIFGPTSELRSAVERIRYVKDLLWEQVASNIALT